MLISFFLMIIISTSLTVPTQPLPRFHVEAWLPFRNCEKDYCQPTGKAWRNMDKQRKYWGSMEQNEAIKDTIQHTVLVRR